MKRTFFWLIVLLWGSTFALTALSAHAEDDSLNEVKQLIQQEQWASAKKRALKLMKKMRKNPEIPYLLATIEERTGKFRAAKRRFRSALGLNRDYMPALLGLTRMDKKLNNNNIVNDYKALTKRDVKNPEWPYRLAKYRFSRNKLDIKNSLIEALKRDPNHRGALNLMVQYYKKIHKTSKAKEYSQRLEKLIPTQASTSYTENQSYAVPAGEPVVYQKNLQESLAIPKKKKRDRTKQYDPNILAQQDAEDRIVDLQTEMQRKRQTIGMNRDRLSILESDVQLKRSEVLSLKDRLEKKKSKWIKLRDLSLEDSEIADAASRARISYQQTQKQLKQVEKEFLALKNDQTRKTKSIRTQENGLRRLAQSIQSQKSEIGRLRINALRSKVEQVHLVKARGEMSCGNNSIKKCKHMALLEAERSAIEQGAAVSIESLTEVANYELVSDNIRSSTSAIILDKKILKKGMIGESAYFYEISAHVKGQLPRNFGTSSRTVTRKVNKKYRLIVQPVPSYAKVQVMNIQAAYMPGMLLNTGEYKLRLSSSGYKTVQMQIDIVDSDITVPIVMTREQRRSNNSIREEKASRQYVDAIQVERSTPHRAPVNNAECRKAKEVWFDARSAYSPTSKMRHLEKASFLCPSNLKYATALGESYLKRKRIGDLKRAIEILDGVLEQEPNNKDALKLRASAEQRVQGKEKMRQGFRNLLNF